MEKRKETLIETEKEEVLKLVLLSFLEEEAERKRALCRARWQKWYIKNREEYNEKRKEKRKAMFQEQRTRADSESSANSESSASSEESTESSPVLNSSSDVPFLVPDPWHLSSNPFLVPTTSSSSSSSFAAEEASYFNVLHAVTPALAPIFPVNMQPFQGFYIQGSEAEMSSQSWIPYQTRYAEDDMSRPSWVPYQTSEVEDETPRHSLMSYSSPLFPPFSAPSISLLTPYNSHFTSSPLYPITSFETPPFPPGTIVPNPFTFRIMETQPTFFENHYQDPVAQSSSHMIIPPGFQFPTFDRSLSSTSSLPTQRKLSKKRRFGEIDPSYLSE